MSLNISFEDLMRECRVEDAKEFRDLLKRNKFQITNSYDERIANKIAWRLGQRVDWFKYKSRQRSEIEEHPLKRGISDVIKQKISQWYDQLQVREHPNNTRDYMIGLVCAGGFLQGRNSEEFLMRFDPTINVIIGDRGSGKSTVLNLISILAGSLSEGSNIFIEKLLSLKEPAEIEQTEFERRLRRTLSTYGVDLLISFFYRGGGLYSCAITRDEKGWSYDVLLRLDNAWVVTETFEPFVDFPLQFLQQGEIVKISESGDSSYLNQIVDSLNDALHQGRAALAQKLKKLNEQYLRYNETQIAYDFGRVEKFIDDRKTELYRLRTQVREKERRYEVHHPILESWLGIWQKLPKPKQFSNVLSLLQTDNDEDLFYFLLGPTIKFIEQARDQMYELESRYRNISRSRQHLTTTDKPVNEESDFYEVPARAEDPNSDIQGDIEPEEEPVNETNDSLTETSDDSEFSRLLQEFTDVQDTEGRELLDVVRGISHQLGRRLNLLEKLVQSYRDARIELTPSLDSLVRSYVDVLQSKTTLLRIQENQCEKLTKTLNAEGLESRVYTQSLHSLLSGYERQIRFLQRLKPLNVKLKNYSFGRNLHRDLLRLNAFVYEYATTIDNLYEQLDHLEKQAAEQRSRDYLFDPIEIEMRQGNIYRNFQNLSFGQKSGLILKIVLGGEDRRILVLDQPEDHLDAYSIDRLIVPTIHSIAASRQIIIATHNSSLLLGLDPQNISVLESMGETGRLLIAGRLSDRDVVREIVAVLEGGIETFNLKIESYEAFVKKLIGSIEDTDIRLIENSFRRRTIDELRNVLQPVISDWSLLGIMRHQLKHEPLLAGHNDTRIGRDIDALRKLLDVGGEKELTANGSLNERLDRLIEDLDADIDSFQSAVESIRLLDTNPTPVHLNLFDFLISLREDYLKTRAGSRIRSIQIDEQLRNEHVFVDKNHFSLVFRNLFDNSFRATELRSVKERRDNHKLPPLSEGVEIRVLAADDYHIELLYTDNGRGIPKEIRNQLYKESVSDQTGKDHGLGGVIIKKLLLLNDAEISVAATGESGTIQKIIIHRSKEQ